MIEHRGPLSGIAAFGDSLVASAGYDNQVVLWDKASKRALARSWHDHLVNQCTFSPDGRYLATSSSDHTARLWRVPDLKLVAVLGDHDDDVEMCAFNPKRPLIATASRDHRVRVYDYSGELQATFEGHMADVISVVWNHDGNLLVSSSDDGTVKCWSLDERRLVENVNLNGVETDTIAISAEGTIFAGNDDGEIVVICNGRAAAPVKAHDAGIKRVVLSPCSRLLITLSYDRTMRLWNVAGERVTLRAVASLPHDVWPRSCAFSGESHIVFATFGSSYRTYDFENGYWADESITQTYGRNAVLPRAEGTYAVGDAGIVWLDGKALSQPGSLCNFLIGTAHVVLTGGQLGRVFNAVTGEVVYEHRSPLNCGAAFVRAGIEHIAIGTYTGEVLVFETGASAVRCIHSKRVHGNAIKGVAASGRFLFSVCADGSAVWQDRDTLEVIRTEPGAHYRIANGCAALEEGRFASISRDLRLRIWDEHFSAVEIATPHTHSIKCVGASADFRLIATAAYDGSIALFDRDRNAWQTFRPTTAGISSIQFDVRSDSFAASSYDGQIYWVKP